MLCSGLPVLEPQVSLLENHCWMFVFTKTHSAETHRAVNSGLPEAAPGNIRHGGATWASGVRREPPRFAAASP